MEFERAKLDIEDPVGIVTLNHPEVMNAVSAEMLGGLMKALDHVEDPKNGVRCVLMTGAGRGLDHVRGPRIDINAARQEWK